MSHRSAYKKTKGGGMNIASVNSVFVWSVVIALAVAGLWLLLYWAT